MTYLLKICYDGTHFCGWQRQRELRSVQSVMEAAAEKVFGAPVKMTASGRTDAGVHALGQVVCFDADTNIPARKIRECMNLQLPQDVKVLKSAVAPKGFDITRDAKKKTYVYRAYYAESEVPLLERYRVRLKQKPDLERMRGAAMLLLGEHDFASFRASGYTSKTSVRTLYQVEVTEEELGVCTGYTISVTGNGFLYNMVRILAGELFAVGCGKEEGIGKAFETLKRSCLAKTMPPNGLCLYEVEYEAPLFGVKE